MTTKNKLANAIRVALRPKRRVAISGIQKSAVVFLLAFGLGAIIAVIINPAIAPYVGALAIPIYGTVTVSFVVINGLITFGVLIPLNRWMHTQDE
jgi:hypothetical protein